MKQIFSSIAALSLAACATVPTAATVRTDGLATIGQSTQIGPFVVTPRAVIEDSRCPINARCVWAGRLRLQADVAFHGGSERLGTVLTLGEPLAVVDGKLVLTSAEPGKLAGSPPSPPASLFGFEAR